MVAETPVTLPESAQAQSVAARLLIGSHAVRLIADTYSITLAQAADCLVICGGDLTVCRNYIDRAIAFPIIRVFDTKESPLGFKVGKQITITEYLSDHTTLKHDAIITKTQLHPVTGVLTVTAQDVVSFSARSVDGHLCVVDMVRKLWEQDHA